MASIVITKQPVDYLTFTAQRSQSPEEDNPTSCKSSPSYTDHDPDISDSSNITFPTTPSSLADFTVNNHKRKHNDALEGEDLSEEDFGTFEDWLRWDDFPSKSASDPFLSMNDGLSSLRSTQSRTSLEDNVVFIEDPVSDPPFQSRNLNFNPLVSASSALNNLNLVGIQPQHTIFNSPLPISGSPWSLPQQQSIQPNYFTSILTPEEEARLRNIAMPNSTPIHTSTSIPTCSSTSHPSSFHASPSPSSQDPINRKPLHSSVSAQRPRRKRKPTTDTIKSDPDIETDDLTLSIEEASPVAPMNPNKSNTGTSAQHQGKKSSHNMIEKRYRNNLNDKISELRDSVPSLRVMSRNLGAGEEDECDDDGERGEDEDLQGLTPAHKLNKATILSKATEYIAHLEKRNAYLTKENAGLKARVDAFEILMVSRQQQQHVQQQQAQQQQAQQQLQYQAMGHGYQGQGGGFVGRGGGWMG